MEYFHAFWSEILKIRRTWAFTLLTVMPRRDPVYLSGMMEAPKKEWNAVWIYYLRRVVWSWLLMVTPRYAALLLALLANADHNGGTWKLLLAQPLSWPDATMRQNVVRTK
jgi:hypothetical protein